MTQRFGQLTTSTAYGAYSPSVAAPPRTSSLPQGNTPLSMAAILDLTGTDDLTPSQDPHGQLQQPTNLQDVCWDWKFRALLANRVTNTATGNRYQPTVYPDPRPRGYSTSSAQPSRPSTSFSSASTLLPESSRAAGMRAALGSAEDTRKTKMY